MTQECGVYSSAGGDTTRFRPAGLPPPPAVDHRPGPVGAIHLLDPSFHAYPGYDTVCVCEVRNLQPVIDELHLDVGGAAASFATVEPASLMLFPDDVGQARIHFQPWEGMPAEPVAFWARVTPASNPAAFAVVEGTVWIAAVPQVGAWLLPPSVADRRGGRHELVIRNHGNTPATVDVDAGDAEGALRFERKGWNGIALPLGGERRLRVEYKCEVAAPAQGSVERPFVVHVTPQGGATEVVAGSFVHRR